MSGLDYPDPWLYQSFGGWGATTQKPGAYPVTEVSAMYLPAFYRSVAILAGDMSQDEICFLQQRKQGDDVYQEKDKNHPAWTLLNRAPNDRMTAAQFRETMQASALIWGNAFALIERNPDRTPKALYPLQPQRIFAYRDAASRGILPQLDWYYTTNQGDIIWLPDEETLQIHNIGDGQYGLAIRQFAQSLGIGLAAQEHAQDFYRNGAMPLNVIQQRAEAASAKAEWVRQLMRDWTMEHGGNRQKPAFVPWFAEHHTVDYDAEKTQLIGVQDQAMIHAANIVGVPLHRVAPHLASSVRANVEQENKAYEKWVLGKWKNKWEQEIELKLLSQRKWERKSVRVEFETNEWKSASLTDQVAAAGAGWRKWWTTNEIRQRFNLNPVPEGDDLDKEAFAQSPEQAGQDADQSTRKVDDRVEVDEEEPAPNPVEARINGHARSSRLHR